MKKLSVLELGEAELAPASEIIDNVIRLGCLADKLKFERMWLGEHYDDWVAWRSPEILIGLICEKTKRLKVGCGGVLLPVNSPLRVSQTYKLLNTLYPGRIDLGLARGFTNETVSKELLNGSQPAEYVFTHESRVQKTINYLREDSHNKCDSDLAPLNRDNSFGPSIWLLGTSGATAKLAVLEEVNYSLSLLHNSQISTKLQEKIFNEYVEEYAVVNGSQPQSNIAIGVACAAKSGELKQIMTHAKKNAALLTNIYGEKQKCFDELDQLFETYKTDEIMINFISNNFKNKVYCYETFSEYIEISNSQTLSNIISHV